MVIPVHDINPVRRTPWITYALVLANLVVFLLMPAVSSSFSGRTGLSQACHLQAFLQRWGAVPRELVHGRMPDLVPTGGSTVGVRGPGCLVAPAHYGKSPPLSVLTSMFVYGSWLHLLGNMLFLWIFGNNIEDRLGRVRYLLLYLVSGYLAAYGYALADADSADPLIGASGAVAGVLGAYLVLYPTARVWVLVPFLFFVPLRLPAWVVLGFWFVLQAFYSSGHGVSGEGTVAYLAHVVGFVFGALVVLPLRSGTPPPPYPRGSGRVLWPSASPWRGRRGWQRG